MSRGQFDLDLNPEIFVDNFAGGGGASTGIYMGLGRHVDHAINHDRIALGMHRINHPQTVHHCEDVYDIDPAALAQGRPIGGAWFSPDCKHHSKAKGGKPLDKKIRGLAFVMLRYAKYGTRVLYMENVEEIAKWGPLLPNGRPDKRHIGRTWKALRAALGPGIGDPDHPDIPEIIEALNNTVTKQELVDGFGYDTEVQEIRAYVYGTPTIRKRLYMVGRNDLRPIVWPEFTHAAPEMAKATGKKRWNIIADCIDFSLPCPSIFLSKTEAKALGFNCKRPLERNTLRRVARGIDRHVLKAKRPFLVNLTHQGGDRVESVDEPAATITGAHRGEKAIVQPSFISEHANASQQRNLPLDEPGRTQCAEVKGGHFSLVSTGLVHTAHGERDSKGKKRGKGEKTVTEPLPSVLGSQDCALYAAHLTKFNTGSIGSELSIPSPTVPAGSHSPDTHGGAATPLGMVTASLVREFGQSVGQGVNEPAPTVMPDGAGKTRLATTHLVRFNSEKGQSDTPRGQEVTDPITTQDTSNRFGVVAASVVNVANSKTTGRGPNTWPVEEPGRTITSSPGFAVAGATLVGAGGPTYSGKPVAVDKPSGTQTTENHTSLATAHMVKLRGANVGNGADLPSDTISAGGTHHGVVSACIVKQQSERHPSEVQAADVQDPAPTIKDRDSNSVVLGSMIKYYSTDQDPKLEEPMHSATTKARFGLNQSEAVTHPLTPEQEAGARRVAAFLRAFGVEFEGEFATVQGYVIVDIGLRMLTPRELFRAQGFPEDYVIDRAWVVDPKTGEIVEVRLTKEQQIRMCGNSVCPQVVAALVRANNPEMIVRRFTERQTQSMERMAA